MRVRLLLIAVLVSLGATCPPTPPTPPQPPDPPVQEYRAYAVSPVLEAVTGRAVEGAAVTIAGQTATTDATGYAVVLRVAIPATVPITVDKAGCEPFRTEQALDRSTPDLPVTLACVPRRPTVAETLHYRGLLANLRDDAGRVIWTPALPGAPDDVQRAWLEALAAAGATHVPIGPFTPGPAYPGVAWPNPDWQRDPQAIRGLVERILATPSQAGHGLVPVVFLDSGGRDPRPRLDTVFPVAAQALEGLWESVIVVPSGWEPVVGDWRSADVSYALERWHAYAPRALIGYHGSPERLVGSSNCQPRDPADPQCIPNDPNDLTKGGYEADDPWKGGESEFYRIAGGQYIAIALFQTRHGRDIYADCDENVSGCWLDRWQDYVARIGGGLNGWRVLPIVAFETVAYEFFNGIPINGRPVTMEDARTNADRLNRVCRKWAVACGFGNGLPRP